MGTIAIVGVKEKSAQNDRTARLRPDAGTDSRLVGRHRRGAAASPCPPGRRLGAVPARLAIACALAGALASLAGCAGWNNYPPAPASVTVAQAPYLIGVGDVLQIVVAANPELSLTVPVRPDGRISLPFAEDVDAQGRMPAQLGRDLEARLKTFVREPMVTVVVTTVAGKYTEQIRVIGQVLRPQSLPYRDKMTLLDAIAAVGGLTVSAAGNGSTLLRVANGNLPYSIRVRDLIDRGDVSANIELAPGDVLIIPQSIL